MIIDLEYANSNGKIQYIGEWHTHPQINPYPSKLDLISLSEITNSSKHINVLLIIGGIGFNKSKFLDQSISIVKYFDQNNFLHIENGID